MTVTQASGVNSQPPFEISQGASFFTRPVKWLRAEDQSDATKDLRKTIALALAFFLCLTIIGIIPVFLASKEWQRQDAISSMNKTDLIVIQDEQETIDVIVTEDEQETTDVIVTQDEQETTDLADQEAQQAAELKAAQLKTEQEAERLANLEAEIKKERERDAQEARRIADKQAAIEAERNANLEAERKALEEARNKKRDPKPKPVDVVIDEQTPVKIGTKTNTRNNDYPSPFETLNRLNIYPNSREEILAKANKALTGFKGIKTEFVDYKALEEILGSGDQLDGLYNEAKILACHILETEQWDVCAEVCKENGIDAKRESFVLKIDMDSRKDFHTYLSMILRALKENKQFPSDPLSDPATWFAHRK